MLEVFYQDSSCSKGFVDDNVSSDRKWHIKGTKKLNCWRIVENRLQVVNHKIRSLFDKETYLFEWTFEFIVDSEANEETLLYYWKGSNALKGFCPLPSEIEDEHAYVERLCQWSETILFLHMFPEHLVVFSCKQEDFNPNEKRLLMVRGELPSELHLYEVPCLKENLRSRGIFLLIEPSVSSIFYWYGSAVPAEYQHLIQKQLNPNKFEESWRNFSTVEIREGHENEIFLRALDPRNGSHFKIECIKNFTPKLFYLNSITGDFLATEVEYPLRSSKHVAAFPVLQSHLYTADQPALFLLDNDNEIWLWEGWITPESNLDLFKTELDLAKETAINYSKERGKSGISIPVKHVLAGLEPIEFLNIFPYWIKRDDVTEKQLKDGHRTGINFVQM
ncbi:hypothetical protein NQ314_018987 [Rhamnusium bicolor]|uniref:Uncharacterized protein n=1 Tax=Rhamnusium bicolor TaxID=1586634 RepID=A0AAV8WQ96_9CUCU|nr:hypothetical protein NQ314_018987 [Rhamnusium bicolor]